MNINESLLNKLKEIRALNEASENNFSFNSFSDDVDNDLTFDYPEFGDNSVLPGADFNYDTEVYTWDKPYSDVVSSNGSQYQVWAAENKITDEIVYFIVDINTSYITFGPSKNIENTQLELSKFDTDKEDDFEEALKEDFLITIPGLNVVSTEELPAEAAPMVPEVTESPVIDVPVEEAPIVEPAPVDSQLGCIVDTANKVMEAYLNANKWMDIIKEFLFTDMGCPFFSSYIHNLAHTMPVRFDKFGDILHTIDMKIPYPATLYIPNEPQGIDDVFNLTFMILDAIKTALNDFIKCTDENYHGMSCAAETLLNDIEAEYVPLYKMRKAWTEYQEPMRFDRWVGTYAEKRSDLNESLNEGTSKDTSHMTCTWPDSYGEPGNGHPKDYAKRVSKNIKVEFSHTNLRGTVYDIYGDSTSLKKLLELLDKERSDVDYSAIDTLDESLNEAYFNNIDKEILAGVNGEFGNGSNLCTDNDVKCSKSAINNVLYFLKHNKPCKLCFGTFIIKPEDEAIEDIGHVWVVDTDTNTEIETHVPVSYKNGKINRKLIKSIELLPEDIDNLSEILKTKLNESLNEDTSFGKMVNISSDIESLLSNKLLERIVLTDNGAYDLEKQGFNGKYVWVGYLHPASGRSSDKLERLIRDCMPEIMKAYKLITGVKPVVNDFINSTDMFRLYSIDSNISESLNEDPYDDYRRFINDLENAETVDEVIAISNEIDHSIYAREAKKGNDKTNDYHSLLLSILSKLKELKKLNESLNESYSDGRFPLALVEKVDQLFERSSKWFNGHGIKVLNTSFDDYYNDNYQCYIVECDNSNALCINELTDDLTHLAMTNNFGYESFGNDNGFYGKTYVFFEFPDANDLKAEELDESSYTDCNKSKEEKEVANFLKDEFGMNLETFWIDDDVMVFTADGNKFVVKKPYEKMDEPGGLSYAVFTEVSDVLNESLIEDTIKVKDGKWTNKGEAGTHGEFKTKKEADALRKAMYANGWKG